MTGVELDLPRLEAGLAELNALRGETRPGSAERRRLEAALDRLFDASNHLIVYGSLAPGGSNHRLLDDAPGEWREGWVTGELHGEGWGAAAGYPGLRWIPATGDAEAPRVAAHLLVSEALPDRFARLDRFEGPGYRRVLVPFFTEEQRPAAVGNLYELAPSP